MQDQPTSKPEEVEEQQNPSNEEENELSYEDTIHLTQATFFRGDRLLSGISKNQTISKKGIIRALRMALNANVTNKDIKLQNDGEAALASAIYETIAARTIMQAHLLKVQAEKELEESKNGESQEQQEIVD